MKNIITLIACLLLAINTHAADFKFAVISDLYVSPIHPQPLEDLREVVNHINTTVDVEFVLVLGNLTQLGDRESLVAAKNELDRLQMKYYAVSGFNETKTSASGATAFAEVFGSERFDFDFEGYRFIGLATGPIVHNMDAHIGVDDVFWVGRELAKTPRKPIIVATHFPLTLNDMDNPYEVTDILRLYNTKVILSGNYRRNMKTNYEGIPAFINKSILKEGYDGLSSYNIYTVSDKSISVAEQKVSAELRPTAWGDFSFNIPYYTKDTHKFRRPSYKVNDKYSKVNYIWSMNIYQSVYSSPAFNGSKLFFGDDKGIFYAYEGNRDNEVWQYETGGRIVGTPAANDKVVVFGSTDKTIYGLDVNNGNLLWQQTTGAAVLGSATISGNLVYIGASDGEFRAIDVNSGNIKWQFTGIGDYIESKPYVFNDLVIFGAWDGKMYALNRHDGTLMWEWSNAEKGRRVAPGGVWPVAADGKVFFTTPKGDLNAISVSTGDSIWSTNEWKMTESIGISEDNQRIYAKTAQESVVCFSALGNEPVRLWSTNVGYGRDTGAAMLVEKGGTVFGSTKNGLIFALHAKTGELQWAHKIGNTNIGTVVPVNGNRCYYVTSQGSLGLLEGRKN